MSSQVTNRAQPPNTSAYTLYTAPSTLQYGTRIVGFTVANPTASPDTYDVYIVPTGDSPTVANVLLYQVTIDAYDSQSPPEVQNQLIPKSGTLQVKSATGATCTFTFSGIEF